MTPTATAILQTGLAMTSTVTTVGTNLEDDKAVTQEGSSQLSATAKQHTTENKKQRGGGGGDDGGDAYTKQNGRTMRKRS